MTFLVLLLVALILLWTPWRTGYPQEGLAPWVEWAGRRGGDWLALLAILSLLLPLGLLLWGVQGLLYGLLTLILRVALLLLCVGRHDPLGRMTHDYQAAWLRGDHAAAGLIAEQQLGVIPADEADVLPVAVQERLVAVTLQDYFVPAFWYLLLGPLGAVAWRLLLLTAQRPLLPAARPAAMLAHALEWIPARLLGLSLALVGHFDVTLRTLRELAANWELPGSELAARCARAALSGNAAEPVAAELQNDTLAETRQLMIRALLTWAVIIAFLSMLG